MIEQYQVEGFQSGKWLPLTTHDELKVAIAKCDSLTHYHYRAARVTTLGGKVFYRSGGEVLPAGYSLSDDPGAATFGVG